LSVCQDELRVVLRGHEKRLLIWVRGDCEPEHKKTCFAEADRQNAVWVTGRPALASGLSPGDIGRSEFSPWLPAIPAE
jgi:hypothetical protein